MKQQQNNNNSRIDQIFEDLEKYLQFCKDYGYPYDESTLYDMRNYVYRQHSKQLAGKQPRNQWDEDLKVEQ